MSNFPRWVVNGSTILHADPNTADCLFLFASRFPRKGETCNETRSRSRSHHRYARLFRCIFHECMLECTPRRQCKRVDLDCVRGVFRVGLVVAHNYNIVSQLSIDNCKRPLHKHCAHIFGEKIKLTPRGGSHNATVEYPPVSWNKSNIAYFERHACVCRFCLINASSRKKVSLLSPRGWGKAHDVYDLKRSWYVKDRRYLSISLNEHSTASSYHTVRAPPSITQGSQ